MDLNWGQTKWNQLFEVTGIVVSLYHFLRRVRAELRDNQIRVEELWDPNGYLSTWVLDGVDLFSNTDKDGLLYVEIVANAANWDINIYKDSARGGGDLVAQAVAAPAGSSAPLVAVNSSITGSVYVEAGVAADSTIWLRPKIGLLKQMHDIPEDDELDGYLKADMDSTLTDVLSHIGSALTVIERFSSNYLLPYVAKKIGSPESRALPLREINTDGVITFEAIGILKDLVDAMDDETVPAAQRIDVGTDAPSYKDGTNDVDNHGQGKLQLLEASFVREGVLTVECETETFPSETFSVKERTNEGDLITSQNYLSFGKAYFSSNIGVSCNPTRIPTDSGTHAARFSDWSFSGADANNTDAGVVYCKWIHATTTLEIYKDSLRTEKVAEGIEPGGGYPKTLNFAEVDSSGLSGSVEMDASPGSNSNDLEVDLTFKKGDKIYVTDLSPKYVSDFLEFFGWLYRQELPRDAAGTIHAGYANRGFSGLSTIGGGED